MGTSLTYISSPNLTPEQRSSILSEAQELGERRRWWCEPIHFFDDPENPTGLTGDTRLFLPGYSTEDGGYVEVEPEHDTFMALRDATAIIDALKHWSEAFGVSWQLYVEGGEIGAIEGGVLDPEGAGFLESLQEMGVEDDSNEAVIGIDQRYSTRWGEGVPGDLFYSPYGASVEQQSLGGQPESTPRGRKWWKFWA